MDSIIEKQTDTELSVKNIKYSQRIIRNFKSTWVIYLVILVGINIMSTFLNAICILLFVSALHVIEYSKWYKYNLVNIIRSEQRIKIEYLQKDELKVIEDIREKFSSEKKRVWYKINTKVMYLIIYFDGTPIIKQYTISDLDEKAMDIIIEMIN